MSSMIGASSSVCLCSVWEQPLTARVYVAVALMSALPVSKQPPRILRRLLVRGLEAGRGADVCVAVPVLAVYPARTHSHLAPCYLAASSGHRLGLTSCIIGGSKCIPGTGRARV